MPIYTVDRVEAEGNYDEGYVWDELDRAGEIYIRPQELRGDRNQVGDYNDDEIVDGLIDIGYLHEDLRGDVTVEDGADGGYDVVSVADVQHGKPLLFLREVRLAVDADGEPVEGDQFWQRQLRADGKWTDEPLPNPPGATLFERWSAFGSRGRVEAIARMFSILLWRDIGPTDMARVIEANNKRQDNTCATHDYLDANMTMAEAFQRVTGHEPETLDLEPGSDPEDARELVHGLWGAAWDLAKKNEFAVPVWVTAFVHADAGVLRFRIRSTPPGDGVTHDDFQFLLADWAHEVEDGGKPLIGYNPVTSEEIVLSNKNAQALLIALDAFLSRLSS